MSDHDERRLAPQSLRAEMGDVGRVRLKGRAIVFQSPSLDLGGFIEEIAPEAVDRTLREALDVRALADHDSGKVLGRTTAGTLSLTKARHGLDVVIDPPDTTFARDLMTSVSRGDITGMSFGFRVLDDDWSTRDGMPLRTVTDMIISEVSVVAFPAYVATDVLAAQRSLRGFLATQTAKGRPIAWLEKLTKNRATTRY